MNVMSSCLLVGCLVLAAAGCDRKAPSSADQRAGPPASQAESTAPIERLDHSKVGVPSGPTARDAPDTAPLAPLTKEQEKSGMPLAGHGNNHSSESLEPARNPAKN